MSKMNHVFALRELQEDLRAKFPNLKNTSVSTICRALRFDLNLSRKVITKHAREASYAEIKAFAYRLQPWYMDPSQLVFVDETSKDGRDVRRRFGWSEIGKKFEAVVPFSRGERISVLAALDVNGFIAWYSTKGTFNRQAFHSAFVSKIVPLLTPWPLPRSIVIIDNAKIHQYVELHQAVESRGAVLIWLPPYSPQLNPIEYAFSLLKRYLQKHCSKVWNVDCNLVLDIAMREWELPLFLIVATSLTVS